MSAAARRRAGAAVAVAMVCALLAFGAREVQHARMQYPPGHPDADRWFSVDADGLYHARRVERRLAEGPPVAARDPLLDFPSGPEGAAIPWPPAYDAFLQLVLSPFAPAGFEARHAWLEHAVARVPQILGALGAALAALAGIALGGVWAGLAAGVYHAFTYGSIHYGAAGVGDHHAWVSLLAGAMLLLLARSMKGSGPGRALQSCLLGAAAGALAGLLLASWVAALLYVVQVQIVLGLLVCAHARRPRAGLAALGFGFHLAAAAVLLPAVLHSPWLATDPWMVVNLSWFHLAELLAGAAVFAPLSWLGERTRRRWPWLVAGALAVAGAVLLATGIGPGAGLREGFAWASRRDAFMAGIAESEPLLGRDRTGSGGLFVWMGFGVLLLPWAWWRGLRATLRGDTQWLPWIVVVPPLLLQALLQRRFADALALPMAVLIGAGLVGLVRGWPRLARHGRPVLAVAVALSLALQAPGLAKVAGRIGGGEAWRRSPSMFRLAGERLLLDRLALEAVPDPDFSVMARWDLGHPIEWVAGLPTVATNFGSYLGIESFQAPARFFLALDDAQAEAVLARREVRFVVVTSTHPEGIAAHQRALGLPADRFLRQGGGGLQAAWFATLGARLMLLDELGERKPPPPPAFLRLIHVSPVIDPLPALRGAGEQRCGSLWERVAGARLQARGEPGAQLEVEIELRFAGDFAHVHRANAVVGAGGVAELRWPYATLAPNGDAELVAARWTLGSAGGELRVVELDVLDGRVVELAAAQR